MRGLLTFIVVASFGLVLTSCILPPVSSPSETSPPPPPTTTPTTPAPPVSPSPLTGVVPEVSQSTEVITRQYSWTYGHREWTWELQIPQSLYDYYQGIPRVPSNKNWSVYVTHPLDDTYIDNLADKIKGKAQEEGFTEFDTVEFAAAFVQSLPYIADSVTTPYDEYPRYPVETLVDKAGDCEDTSILMASLFNSMGYGVVLFIFPGHVAVGVLGGEGISGTYIEYNGGKYFYLETTNTGWKVGQIPEEYQGLTAHVYDMKSTPILIHEWKANGRGNTIEMEVTVENLGSAAANDAYVLAGFDAGDNRLWNAQESQLFNLAIGQQITITFTLQAPPEEHTRLVIQVIDDDHAVDESHSQWFDT